MLSAVASAAPGAAPPRLKVVPLEREPADRQKPAQSELTQLRQAVDQNPKLRKSHFQLVHALLRSSRLEEAHARALAWRDHDAYNLVAVRLLGDIEMAQGDRTRARRTYSAIAELLPRDVEARRALATVMKESGDLAGARAELLAALGLREQDHRTRLELGDVEQRLGQVEEARQRFEATANASDASEDLRYPAKQRLGQILAAERRAALDKGNSERAGELARAIDSLGIRGGVENDLKVFLAWDSDRTDVDLWVTTPSGEKVSYQHKQGAGGEALFDDVTSGYGPESFTAHDARPGDYLVQVNYFGGRSPGAFKEARGEVTVVLDEGRAGESRAVLPYRLFREKDTVTVAKVHVNGRRGQ